MLEMWHNLTFNSILWIILGLFVLALGALFAYGNRYSPLLLVTNLGGAVGIAVGCITMGLTNGFTDHSALGRTFSRIGAFGFIVGIPLIGYSFSGYLR